nr:protein FAM154A [Hymenolepis microstoma]
MNCLCVPTFILQRQHALIGCSVVFLPKYRLLFHHKCSHIHPKRNEEPFSKVTEYTERYIGQNGERAKSLKPKAAPIQSIEPLSAETTHRHDFVSHPLEPRKQKEESAQHVPVGTFEGQSVYNSDYTKKGIIRVAPFVPQTCEKKLEVFEGEATYTADYKEWDVEPHNNNVPKYEYQKPIDSFNGESIYSTDYVNHGFVKPPNAIKPSPQPIQSGSFDGISTFTADYIPKNADKQMPFRPKYTPLSSNTPFTKETTHNVDYTEKPLPEHFRRNVEEYKPSSAEFDGRTTYRDNYMPLEGKRAKMIKPVSEAPAYKGEFSDMTNYKKEYRRWSIKARESSVQGPPKYLPPEVPFDGQTIYQNEYMAKFLEPCPVMELHSNPDVICEGEDEYGHEFYSTRVRKKQKAVAEHVKTN